MKRFYIFVICFLALASFAGYAEISQMIRYVGVDFNRGTGYVYDEKFVLIPEEAEHPRTSTEYLPEDHSIWMLALQVDIVRRLEDGTVEVKNDDPAYAKLPHHLVFSYVDGIKPVTDIGGQRPIALGNELTDVVLPPPYAYQMRGGKIYPWNWHWHNLGGVAIEEEVYIRLTLTVDDTDSGYIDTNVTWVDAVFGSAEFCVPPGESVYDGQRYPVGLFSGGRNIKAVAVIPHIHDHGIGLQLVRNGDVVSDFLPEPEDNFSYHISHAGCNSTGWHSHEGHLRTKGLNNAVWTPGTNGPIFSPSDNLWSRSYYDNPHDRNNDAMGILVTFWEALK